MHLVNQLELEVLTNINCLWIVDLKLKVVDAFGKFWDFDIECMWKNRWILLKKTMNIYNKMSWTKSQWKSKKKTNFDMYIRFEKKSHLKKFFFVVLHCILTLCVCVVWICKRLLCSSCDVCEVDIVNLDNKKVGMGT
jgi:hypothetical protein